jgi:hypothetical protein
VAVLPRLSVDTGSADIRTCRLSAPQLQRRLRAVARASALSRPVIGAVVDALAGQATRAARAAQPAQRGHS